jgi:hypothetical protein
MLLSIAVLNPETFTQVAYFEKIISQLNTIPIFLSHIWNYLIFIVGIELILMFFETIFTLLGVHDPEKAQEGKVKEKN